MILYKCFRHITKSVATSVDKPTSFITFVYIPTSVLFYKCFHK